jgi:hypothetical protein
LYLCCKRYIFAVNVASLLQQRYNDYNRDTTIKKDTTITTKIQQLQERYDYNTDTTLTIKIERLQ